MPSVSKITIWGKLKNKQHHSKVLPDYVPELSGTNRKSMIPYVRRRASVVSAPDLGSEGQEFQLWPVHPCCVLRQNSLSQCLSPPRCINGNHQIAWGQPDILLEGNLRWTSIPSRGSRNTPSRFILKKLEINAGTVEPFGSPNFDWGQILPTT